MVASRMSLRDAGGSDTRVTTLPYKEWDQLFELQPRDAARLKKDKKTAAFRSLFDVGVTRYCLIQ